MTWLSEYQQKFAQEDAQKVEKKEQEADEGRGRHNCAASELTRFVESALKDLVGRKTRDGEILRLELDKDRASATMYGGDEKFLYISFWYKENEKYDGDGCSYGDGTYFLKKDVHYCRPHKSRRGYDEPKDKWGSLYEEDLAYYLLKFLEP